MDNKKAIRYLKQLPAIKKRLAANKKKYASLEKSIIRDKRIVRKLETYKDGPVNEIYKGQLLLIWESMTICDIEGIADDNFRHADIYLNAHNKTTYGGHLKIYGTGYGSEEVFLGSNWENKEDLLEICKDFLALAKMPKLGNDWLSSKFKNAVKKFKEEELKNA
jgi:hypothetical protein